MAHKNRPSQIDQILANLCINARDAITGSGNIVIKTANISWDEAYCADRPDLSPGDYVMLSVSDNGCGMTPETLDNIFDPFFTTKGVAKGSGLGLSTVYGIVKQYNGCIEVFSEMGEGTTFNLYFSAIQERMKRTRAKTNNPKRFPGEMEKPSCWWKTTTPFWSLEKQCFRTWVTTFWPRCTRRKRLKWRSKTETGSTFCSRM